jgi:hypothetical protein
MDTSPLERNDAIGQRSRFTPGFDLRPALLLARGDLSDGSIYFCGFAATPSGRTSDCPDRTGADFFWTLTVGSLV